MSHYSNLQHRGLTNSNAMSFGELATAKRKYSKSYCTSMMCCQYRDKKGRRVYRSKVLCNVDLSRVRCEDCGSYVVWK